jgi:hypothetical protein
MAAQAQFPLSDFTRKMEWHYAAFTSAGDGPSWRTNKKKVQWAIAMEKEVMKVRAVVTMKLVAVCTLLAIPTG